MAKSDQSRCDTIYSLSPQREHNMPHCRNTNIFDDGGNVLDPTDRVNTHRYLSKIQILLSSEAHLAPRSNEDKGLWTWGRTKKDSSKF